MPSGEGPVGVPDLGKGSKNAADQMWVARYILARLGESYGVDIEWRCKPILAPSSSR